MSYAPKNLPFCVSEAKKSAGIFCAAYGCKSKPCSRKRGLCHKHYARHRRIVDPVYARYTDFKKHALERGKDFTITLDQFRKWCAEVGYLEKGRRGRAATVDRIDNRQGYHIWNIQLLTHKANIMKYHNHDKLYTPF